MLSLVGSPAPELARDSTSAPAPPSLRALRGRPVVLFVWAEWCGDCKAQAASLGRVLERHRASGLACVALTRRYDESDSAIVAETARADSVWRAVYSALPDVRHAVSTASMVEYGGSSTPTFVFVDRKGVVRGYTPTRLTEEELERAVAGILRE
jgi:thiol-disulfide isomerase/thioredoxin